MKSYTDIEQSKKLAEFLPIESADMGWYYSCNPQAARNQMWVGTKPENADIPCWSLAALLNIIGHYTLQTVSDSKRVIVVSENGNPISSFSNPQPVDACYEMILKLHELNLL